MTKRQALARRGLSPEQDEPASSCRRCSARGGHQAGLELRRRAAQLWASGIIEGGNPRSGSGQSRTARAAAARRKRQHVVHHRPDARRCHHGAARRGIPDQLDVSSILRQCVDFGRGAAQQFGRLRHRAIRQVGPMHQGCLRGHASAGDLAICDQLFGQRLFHECGCSKPGCCSFSARAELCPPPDRASTRHLESKCKRSFSPPLPTSAWGA